MSPARLGPSAAAPCRGPTIPVPRRRALRILALWVPCSLLLALPAAAIRYERSYPVDRVEIEYALDHPRHIPTAELVDLEVGLRADDGVFVAPRPVDRTVRMRLSSLPRDTAFSASALLHINQYLVATFNRRGYNGVIVSVPDIEEGTGRDLRPPGDTVLRLRIWTGRITRVTSVADGERFRGLSVDARTNHAAHAWIRERSPVRPGGARGLLSVRRLEDFAAEVSRHPGRRVEAELEPGPRTGTTAVNLRVIEAKPWIAYAQYRNTGTDATTENRESFGFRHQQLTGRDDILDLVYSTGDFDDVHAVAGAYNAPFSLEAPEWRFDLHGSYSRFDTREAGIRSNGLEGREISLGGQVSRQLWQHGPLFVDAVLGVDWERLRLDQEDLDQQTAEATVETDYTLPRAELRVERETLASRLGGRLAVVGGFTDAPSGEIAPPPNNPPLQPTPEFDLFGTPGADENFVLARLDLSWAAYLEPLLDPQAWQDPSTPESSTLAHEVAVALRGQYAFGHRLIPRYQEVAGGFDSVRGYEQSIAVGDDAVGGTLEYRLHLPRLFRPSDRNPPTLPLVGPFRARAGHVYDVPDWDLIVRVFGDAAYLHTSDALVNEPDETLVSAGAGLELRVLRYLNLRADVGHALTSVRSRDGDERHDTRAHLGATVLY